MKTIPLIGLIQTTTRGAVPPRVRTIPPAVNVAILCRGEAKVQFSVVDRALAMSGISPTASFGAYALGLGVNACEAKPRRSDLRLTKETTQWS
jgi:hypothetical protein